MNDAINLPPSRRRALRLLGRGLMGAALATVAGLAAGRRPGRLQQSVCAAPSACARCAALRDCTLPPALVFRGSEAGSDRRGEARHGG